MACLTPAQIDLFARSAADATDAKGFRGHIDHRVACRQKVREATRVPAAIAAAFAILITADFVDSLTL